MRAKAAPRPTSLDASNRRANLCQPTRRASADPDTLAPATSPPSATVTVHIPLSLYRRGGHKFIIGLHGETWRPQPARIDNAMIKALARAFRWRKPLETGVHGTIDDLANAEKLNSSYVSRVLRLTLLAPDIVEAILDGRQPIELRLDELKKAVPIVWGAQTRRSPAGQ